MSDIKNIIKVEVPLIDKRYNGVNSNDTFKARLFKNQFPKPHYLPRDIEQLKAVDNIHALVWYDENALSYEEDRLFFKDINIVSFIPRVYMIPKPIKSMILLKH